MNKELCAGGILFRKSETGEVKYLLIQSKSWKNWAFPKGHVEENESKEQAAIREIFEETGLNIELLPGFAEGYEYEFDFQGKHIKKEVVFFLAEAKESSIKLNEQEHQEHSWLSYDKAIGLVTHKEDKEVLKKANQFLSGKNE